MAASLATGIAIERTSQNATPMPMVSATSRQATRIVTDRDDAAATELRADWIELAPSALDCELSRQDQRLLGGRKEVRAVSPTPQRGD
jgi:hypothetical protein